MKHTLFSTALLAAFVLLGEKATRAGETGPVVATPASRGTSGSTQTGRENDPTQVRDAFQQRYGLPATSSASSQAPYGWLIGLPGRENRALVVNSSPLGLTNLAEIEEDLTIMARILEKALDEDPSCSPCSLLPPTRAIFPNRRYNS